MQLLVALYIIFENKSEKIIHNLLSNVYLRRVCICEMSDLYLPPLNITTTFNSEDFNYQDNYVTYRIRDMRYISGIIRLEKQTTAISFLVDTTTIHGNVDITGIVTINSNFNALGNSTTSKDLFVLSNSIL